MLHYITISQTFGIKQKVGICVNVRRTNGHVHGHGKLADDHHCVRICIGMLLEMDLAALQQLLCDQSTLAKAVQKAQAALDN